MRKFVRVAMVAAIASAAIAFVPTSAQAATRCGTVHYSQGSGGASVSCASTGTQYSARIKVTCNAVFPFSPWTKYGSTHTITKYLGQSWSDSSSVFPSCPSPATASATIQYL